MSGDRRAVRGGEPHHHRPRRSAAVGPARQAAFDVLVRVSRDEAFANLLLPALLRERHVAGRDAALATELCYGTLRWRGTLDTVIAAGGRRDVSTIDAPVLEALRLGAYQLLFTRVPAHAAVNATVTLVRRVASRGAAGFANAVMRRVSERDFAAWTTELAPAADRDPRGHLVFAHAHPRWIVDAFADALDGDLDEVAAALAADNVAPAVHMLARPGRVDRDALAEEVAGTPGAYSPFAVHLAGGAPADLAALGDGRASVQDEGSQLVALALAAAPTEGPDSRWLDLCAGPGGKAALLGALAVERQATVVAAEVSAHRARLVEVACQGLPVTVVPADGRLVGEHPDLATDAFDRVLVDVPCTGLGALRRRPEARWRRRPEDLADLTQLQSVLLAAALRAVRVGGVVAYVTCSPHLAETRDVLAGLPEAGSAVEMIDARPLLPGSPPHLGDGPAIQLWPHRHGTDAMFIALLRRTS